MSTSGKITASAGTLLVPGHPIIPYIEGDGIGPDLWAAAVRVFDAAVEKAYDGRRKISWKEVLAGGKSFKQNGEWLPQETLEAFREYLVGIKGPLTTPIGGGIRSLNVALRQGLDLYVCLRPVRYFPGVPSPVKKPELIDMVIFRENIEDNYAGIEFEAGTGENQRFLQFLKEKFLEKFSKIRFPETVGIGIKPISQAGSARLVRAAIKYAIENNRKSVTLVHKGNIMKYTEGAFRDWGYQIAKEEFGSQDLDGGPWQFIKTDAGQGLIIKDVIADNFLQQILIRAEDYDVVATMNLNGDYISDALAAQVGGIGISPGGNINYNTGHAIFEATHGTAPEFAGRDMLNPSSIILSGEMMLRYLDWNEAADLIIKAMEMTIAEKRVTCDFSEFMEGATTLKTSEFGNALIENM